MPSSPALRSTRSIVLKFTDPYVCPTCCFQKATNTLRRPKKPDLRSFAPARRAASTITSVTAVNAKTAVPHAFRELHDALNVLQREAAVYTNLSQLQLALRGLESENGVTRIAGLLSVLLKW